MAIDNNPGLAKNRFNGSNIYRKKKESTFVMNTIPLLASEESVIIKSMVSAKKQEQPSNITVAILMDIVERITVKQSGQRPSKGKML